VQEIMRSRDMYVVGGSLVLNSKWFVLRNLGVGDWRGQELKRRLVFT
jgi:hypothetical protein